VVNAIEVKELTKNFNSFTAVDDISFEVEESDFFGFLGPNGAGKTTTIRMLTGVIKPTSGTISILGYDIAKQTLSAKELMGIIPEVSNAYTDLSGWNNMIFQGELYGLDRVKRIRLTTELLKDFELYDRRNQLVKFYSKGMKQKLIICLALLNNPKILFLDEPTSGLDIHSTLIIREKLLSINENGTTIFLTTHNMAEAGQLCEKIAIINKGKIAAINSPENLKLTVKELQSITVAFQQKVEIESFSGLSRVNQARKVGDKFQLFTKNPDELISQLVSFAKERNLKILTLNTETPTLEEVFLKLTKARGEK
jgi:ABC-2 type transport system ATP-binding protein